MQRLLFVLFVFGVCQMGCIQQPIDFPEEVEGMAPIYASEVEADILSVSPRSIRSLGKFYAKGPYLYAIEQGHGIHVFDNSDPTQPTPQAFWQIAHASELAIRGDYLYTNHFQDLVSIDISDPAELVVIDRIPNAFTPISNDFPASFRGFFECADPEAGLVVGWEARTIRNPQCYR